MQTLQPRPPEAALAIDGLALGEPALAALLDPAGLQEPAVREIAQQILAITDGIDAPTQLRRMVYSLQDGSAPEYLLLADMQANTIAALYAGDEDEPERIGRYLGVDLYQHPTLDLTIAMLPGALFAAGAEATLEDLIEALNEPGGTRDTAIDDSAPPPIQLSLVLPAQQSPRYPLSLNEASELAAGFTLQEGVLQGSLAFAHPRAARFVARFNELAEDGSAAALRDDAADVVRLPISLPLSESADRFAIKQLFYGFDGVSYAEQVGVNQNPAWLNFNVGINPNSIFINFEFASAAQRAAFEENELPPGFRLAPLRILEDDEPTYFLVLNVYRSSGGLVEGARAEWSVFVDDPETGEPRFLVVQAAAEAISADPVNLLTFPEPVSHTLDGGEVVSFVGTEQADGSINAYFKSSFPLPGSGAPLRRFARELVAANDFIFWGNGVADRGVFNGSVYATRAQLINPDTLQVTDNSRWARYVNPAPRHSVIYRNALEIIISPWWNLGAPYLDVTEDFLQELIDFSNGFYPMTALAAAEAAFRGEQDVVRAQQTEMGVATLNLHFRITDPQALTAALNLPEGKALALLPLTDEATPEQVLTLEAARYADSSCGWQARWLAYVRDNATGKVTSLILQNQSAAPCLHADTLLQPGSHVALQSDNGRLQLDTADLTSAVSVNIDTTSAALRLPGLDWLQAQDTVCSLNGICDRRFIDGQTLSTPLMEIDPSGVTLGAFNTAWADYIEREPLAVWVGDRPRLQVSNPWYNARPDKAP